MRTKRMLTFLCQARDGSRRNGFTLTELVVALTVLSVAVAGLIAMFGAALSLAQDAQDRITASEISAAQLRLICASPGLFLWQKDQADASGLFPIVLSNDQPLAGVPIKAPEARMATRAAQERIDAQYSRFRWEAWGRYGSPDAGACEVTVSVHWQRRGRTQTLALTSAIPTFLVERETALAAAASGVQP